MRRIAAGALAAPWASVHGHGLLATPFALDWKFEGPSAACIAAIDNGHCAELGLEVAISAGRGSLDAIPKATVAPVIALMFAVLIALALLGILLLQAVVLLERIFAGWAARAPG